MIFTYTCDVYEALPIMKHVSCDVGVERLFSKKKNQENERRGTDICGNGKYMYAFFVRSISSLQLYIQI